MSTAAAALPGPTARQAARAASAPPGRQAGLLERDRALRPGQPPAPPGPPGRDRLTRRLGWGAVAGIGGATLLMIAIALAGPSRAVIYLAPYQSGPLVFFRLRLPAMLVSFAIWLAVLAGGAGVAAGLAAVARGARPPVRLLVGLALAATALLTVVPSAGSTDTLDYAAYGRMVAIGHDPYVMTPYLLRLSGDPIGQVAPWPWQQDHSVYGPLATVEQAAAAELGGTSPGWIVFWLKLWNSLAFIGVVLALDRLLRNDPVRRARAHLLWSANPLLLWALIAGGHIDSLAVGFGFLGLMILHPRRGYRRRPAAGRAPGSVLARVRDWAGEQWAGSGPGVDRQDPGILRAAVAGLLVGAASDVKITLGCFGFGVAWAVRKRLWSLTAAAAGALFVLVPSYLWFGPPAITALLKHSSATADNLYRIFAEALGNGSLPQLSMVALPVFGLTALLLMRRLPDGFPALPAVRPAFALGLAWLLTWPYQRPWYDAMAFCLLALYPATRLDWPLIARLVAGLLYSTPGMPGNLRIPPLGAIQHELMVFIVPATRLGALVTVVLLCLTMAWQARQPFRLRLAGLVPLP